MKHLIRNGLTKYRLEAAITLYQRGELDLSAAALHANVSIYHMMTELEQRDITPSATAQKFTAGLQTLIDTFGGSDALQQLVNRQ